MISDTELVRDVLEGDRAALSTLLGRYQPFVFNLALKMYGNRADAEDLTQEVVIKVITSLKSFRADAKFSTWLYRITVNHFLSTRKRGMELEVSEFPSYFDSIAAQPDDDGPRISDATIEELRVRCLTGMLMCLDRSQRMVFLLGAMLRVSNDVAADALQLSVANFRVKLHRARADLYAWMHGRCGLVNTANPCRCHKKARAFERQGLIDPKRLVFTREHTARVDELVAREANRAMLAVEDAHEVLFQSHPVQTGATDVINELLRLTLFS